MGPRTEQICTTHFAWTFQVSRFHVEVLIKHSVTPALHQCCQHSNHAESHGELPIQEVMYNNRGTPHDL